VRRDALEDPDQSFNDVVFFNWFSDQDAISQEFRLQNQGEALDWLVGVHYYKDEHDVENTSEFFNCFAAGTCETPNNFADQSVLAAVFGLPPAGVGGFPTDPDAYTAAVQPITTGIYASLRTDVLHEYDQENESYALFGQGTYNFNPAWALTAGLRYTYEERSIAATSTFSNPMSFNTGYPLFEGKRDWDDLSGKVTLEYRPADDLLFFGTVSKGFRAGNWNGAAFFDPEEVQQPVDPETVINYEAGVKSELFDGRLQANATVFYMDFQDKQEFIFRDGQIFLENAAEATSQGVELELLFAPTDNLIGTFGAGYLDTEYGEFNAVLQSENNTGNELPNSPELTLNGSLNYQRAVSENWEWSLGGDFRYVDDLFFQANNDPVVAADAYTVVNLRTGFSSQEHGFDITLFADNVFDEEYFVDGNDIGVPFFWSILTQGRPRTVGVRLETSF
jgi:iron complex outermembrane receptor protein